MNEVVLDRHFKIISLLVPFILAVVIYLCRFRSPSIHISTIRQQSFIHFRQLSVKLSTGMCRILFYDKAIAFVRFVFFRKGSKSELHHKYIQAWYVLWEVCALCHVFYEILTPRAIDTQCFIIIKCNMTTLMIVTGLIKSIC